MVVNALASASQPNSIGNCGGMILSSTLSTVHNLNITGICCVILLLGIEHSRECLLWKQVAYLFFHYIRCWHFSQRTDHEFI